jgi:hypothetical protein
LALKTIISSLKEHSLGTLVPLVDRKLLERNQMYTEIEEWLHPSSIPTLETICPRALFFDKFTPIEKYPKKLLLDDFSPRTYRIFDNGHAVHRRWQMYLIEAGVIDPAIRKGWEVPVFSEELGVIGHADGIAYPDAKNDCIVRRLDGGSPLLTDEGFQVADSKGGAVNWSPAGEPVLVEIKSMRDDQWRWLIEPLPSHTVQTTCYMALLDLRSCVTIYESKDTQQVKEYHRGFRPDLWHAFRKIFKLVQQSRRKQVLPEGVCASVMDKRAGQCPWADVHCFTTKSYAQLISIEGIASNGTDQKGAKRAKR